jgi:hypothetical protein
VIRRAHRERRNLRWISEVCVRAQQAFVLHGNIAVLSITQHRGENASNSFINDVFVLARAASG